MVQGQIDEMQMLAKSRAAEGFASARIGMNTYFARAVFAPDFTVISKARHIALLKGVGHTNDISSKSMSGDVNLVRAGEFYGVLFLPILFWVA